MTDARNRIVSLVLSSSIAPVETRFVVAPYIPRGEATWIEGVTKSGKTMVLCDIVARITRGELFPTGAPIDRGRAAILTCEDSPERTIIPRLIAAGADLSRVSIVRVEDAGEEVLPSFLTDLDGIERGLRDDNVALVGVDGTFGVLGVRDSSSYTEAYATMLPFVAMIRRLEIGAAILRHVRKSDASALNRGVGSVGFASLGRSTISIAVDKDDETGARRLFAHAGSNVGEIGPTIAFEIEGVPIEKFERTVGRVRWGEIVDLSADEVMADRHGEDRSAVGAACDFIEDLLGNGPCQSNVVYAAADRARISRASLRRAQKKLGVKRARDGERGPWLMTLPAPGAQPAHAVKSEHVRPKVSTYARTCSKEPLSLEGKTEPSENGFGSRAARGQICQVCRKIDRCYLIDGRRTCGACAMAAAS